MKNKFLSLIAIPAMLLNSGLKAQFGVNYGGGGGNKIMKETGEVSAIKSEKEFNIQHDYSTFAVGKFKTEGEYTKSKMEEYNKKEAGKGDKWLAGWVGARKATYEPMFENMINKVMGKKGYKFAQGLSSKYTLTVKTTYIEPGYNIGISKQPAFANFDFIWTETANPSNVVLKLYVQNVIGQSSMGFDFDVSSRIKECYAKSAKLLGKYLLKNMAK